MPTFDGDNLLIVLDSGVTTVSVKVDLYSDWKEWYKTSDNSKYPLAFRSTGGDPLTPTLNAGAYYFLQNQYGWRIRPPEEDIDIVLSSNLYREDLDLDIFVPTLGGYTVGLAVELSSQTIALNLTKEEIADQVWDEDVTGHVGPGSYGDRFNTVIAASVVGGGATISQFKTTLTAAVDNHYKGRIIIFTTGILAGQATDIKGYNGSTKTVQVTPLTSAPLDGSEFVVT